MATTIRKTPKAARKSVRFFGGPRPGKPVRRQDDRALLRSRSLKSALLWAGQAPSWRKSCSPTFRDRYRDGIAPSEHSPRVGEWREPNT